MTSYLDYCLNLLTTATETIGNMLTPSESPESQDVKNQKKDPNNNKEEWVDLEKEHLELKKTGQFLDENHPNYVCPSVDYDFVRDHGSYIVVYNNVHEPRMQERFDVND